MTTQTRLTGPIRSRFEIGSPWRSRPRLRTFTSCPAIHRRCASTANCGDSDAPPLDPNTVRELLARLCPAYVMGRFRSARNVDFSLELTLRDQLARFRVNYFLSGEQAGACFRLIPSAIPDFRWAGLSEDLAHRLAHFRNGLVLICGVVGSGKTTSLAMLVNQLNQEGGYRIVTIEEPVEYLFPKTPASVVTQREVGRDVHTFADGLKYALRQDPDVILVGEIRDRPTAQMALSAAQTGHLVLSTLHTRDAKGAISRYADFFPQSVQHEIRSQLASSLAPSSASICCPRPQGGETGVGDGDHVQQPAHRRGDSFRQTRVDRQPILTGRAEGMRNLDESIRQLLKEGRISRETAERFASPGAKPPSENEIGLATSRYGPPARLFSIFRRRASQTFRPFSGFTPRFRLAFFLELPLIVTVPVPNGQVVVSPSFTKDTPMAKATAAPKKPLTKTELLTNIVTATDVLPRFVKAGRGRVRAV